MTSEDKPTTNSRDLNRRIIRSDRIKRIPILDGLWKNKRTNEIKIVTSEEIMKYLQTSDRNETHFHLDTLKELGLIRVDFVDTSGSYDGIEITGHGTTTIEDFFLSLDDEIRRSDNPELQKQIQEIDRIDDVYMKHDRYGYYDNYSKSI